MGVDRNKNMRERGRKTQTEVTRKRERWIARNEERGMEREKERKRGIERAYDITKEKIMKSVCVFVCG